jgi:ribosomal protein L16 Arg81 hydroxylase
LARSVSNKDGVSISWLLAPIQPEKFFRDYWEKQPLVIERDAPAYYQSLLTLHDVDRILASSSIRPPEISLAKNGKNVPFGLLHTNDLITQPVMHDALSTGKRLCHA